MLGSKWLVAGVLSALLTFGCDGGQPSVGVSPKLTFSVAAKSDAAAFLSVHGTAANDVWIAGVDDGKGPVVLHFDGSAWERKATGVRGNLWWAHASAEGPVLFAGEGGLLLRYQDGAFERLKTP